MAPKGDEWTEFDRRLRVVENTMTEHLVRCEEQNKNTLRWLKALTFLIFCQTSYMILAPDEPFPVFIAKHLKQ